MCKKKIDVLAEFLPPKNSLGEQGFWNFTLQDYPKSNFIYLLGLPSKGETKKICSFYVVLNFEEITLG
jgi:hypothetical protein